MYPVKQSTALTVPFFCMDAAGDPVTSLLTGDFTNYISKGGAGFVGYTVTVTELGYGWYTIPVAIADTATLGVLTIVLTHASCKQVNLQFRVSVRIPDDLAYPTSSGRSMDVTSDGFVSVNLDDRYIAGASRTGALAYGTDYTGLNNLSAAQVNAEVDTALNTAIPGSPTADSVNERIVALDGKLPSKAYLTGTANSDGDIEAGDMTGNFPGSVASVAGAVGSVTGNVGGNVTGSVASVAGNVGGNVTGSVGSVAAAGITAASFDADAIDASALAADAVDEILDEVVEGTTTLRQMLRIFASVLSGKSSGGGTATLTFRDIGDTKARLIATVDVDGNRTAIGTRDGT